MLSLCFDKCGSNLFVTFLSHGFVLPKLINFYPSKKIPTYIVLAGSVHPIHTLGSVYSNISQYPLVRLDAFWYEWQSGFIFCDLL